MSPPGAQKQKAHVCDWHLPMAAHATSGGGMESHGSLSELSLWGWKHEKDAHTPPAVIKKHTPWNIFCFHFAARHLDWCESVCVWVFSQDAQLKEIDWQRYKKKRKTQLIFFGSWMRPSAFDVWFEKASFRREEGRRGSLSMTQMSIAYLHNKHKSDWY